LSGRKKNSWRWEGDERATPRKEKVGKGRKGKRKKRAVSTSRYVELKRSAVINEMFPYTNGQPSKLLKSASQVFDGKAVKISKSPLSLVESDQRQFNLSSPLKLTSQTFDEKTPKLFTSLVESEPLPSSQPRPHTWSLWSHSSAPVVRDEASSTCL
jgi:hypothetical protein